METPYLRLLSDSICFWLPTQLFRILGELVYKVIFDLFGWNPLPWRFPTLAPVLGNALLFGHVAQCLSGSMIASLLAMSLAAYHPHWVHLYFNAGTILEMLAFTFVWDGMALYL